MPDIDPAALSRTGSGPQPSTTPLPPLKSLSTSTPASQKASKTISMGQRIDLEPLYTALKAAIAEHWVGYKEAISLFALGHLNQAELSSRIDYYITADPATEHLHNQLISAIYGNVTRDLPDHGVAGWVSANDKPTTVSKPVSGDAAEQRLKTEAMQLPARDRRRIKDIPETGDAHDMYSGMLNEYHHAKQIKQPDMVPTSAGGHNKTNWDLEIRRRYSQALACETGEFPDTESIQGRMEPMCYEEGIMNGASDGAAAFMNVATETFVKEVLSGILARTRSNGANYIMTSTYKRQLEREEAGWLRGTVQKNANSLLPVEATAASQRGPLGMNDFRLSLEMGDMYLGHMPLALEKIMGGYVEGELQHQRDQADGLTGTEMDLDLDLDVDGEAPAAVVNGTATATPNGTTTSPTTSTTTTKPSPLKASSPASGPAVTTSAKTPLLAPASTLTPTSASKATSGRAASASAPASVSASASASGPGTGTAGGTLILSTTPLLGHDVEDSDWGWEGGGLGDRDMLGGLLDDCLSVG
ncbi:MAG: transcriptional coactivator hfi1/ADA1 [Thelocarpon superellum]|nr:MAG: transcriptional coactivator hfi1/ADA1 [Thelocarpon superellum]